MVGARRGGGPEGVGGPKGWGARRGGGPKVVGARRVGGPKFRAFFSLPPEISFFLPSLGVFSWNFGGV